MKGKKYSKESKCNIKKKAIKLLQTKLSNK